MVKQFQENFANMTYDQANQYWPGVREHIFEAVKGITPNQFAFELNQINLPFNLEQEVDEDTFAVISTVLASALDEPHILLTRGDIQCAYYRFAHLLWVYEVVRQGIYEPVVVDGALFYRLKNAPRSTYNPRTVFATRDLVSFFRR